MRPSLVYNAGRRGHAGPVMDVNEMMDQPPLVHEPEWIVKGTPDSLKAVLIQVAEGFQAHGYYFRASERPSRTGLSYVQVEARGEPGTPQGPVGIIHVDPLNAGRSRLLIRPDNSRPTSIAPRLFSEYLSSLRSELRRLRFLVPASRFSSYEVLQAAERELGAADEPATLAAVGNMFRSAVIDLANELYAPVMSKGGPEPQGDNAGEKLRLVATYYFAGRSERYTEGLGLSIEGSWKMINALPHRKRATREEVEACAALVRNLFEAFSFIAPQKP